MQLAEFPAEIEFPDDRKIGVVEKGDSRDIALDTLWAAIEAGADVFHAAVAGLAAATHCKWVYVTRFIDECSPVEVIAMWQESKFADCFDYELEDTPCELVLKSENPKLFKGAAEKFPKDEWLSEMGVEDYIGQSYKNSAGEVVGHIGLMHNNPFIEIPSLEESLGVVVKALEIELDE